MATFTFTALDGGGKEVEGTIDAESQAAALSALKDRSLFPTDVSPQGGASSKKSAPPAKSAAAGKGMLSMELKMPGFLGGKVKTKQLMVLTRQLSTLINAGLPLLRGLQVLQRQEKNATLKRALNQMADTIQSGSTFAEALAQHPRIFNKLFVNMVKAGEVGGVLDTVLDRLAEFMEKAQKIKNKIVAAMVYPVVVLIMAGGIMSFLMIVIIPKFEEIFDELLEGAALPPLTQFVMAVSRGFSTDFIYVAMVIAAVVIGIKLVGKTAQGGYLFDKMKFYMPIFGNLVRLTSVSRFARTLGTLMNSGVPVLQALNIVRDTAGNEALARAINQVHDAVKEGENMAPPIEASKVFPPMVVSMIEVGEETGALPDMLMRVADNYEDEVDNAVSALTSIIEPILIILLALIVGTIVIALFMPLVSIIGKLS